MGNNTGALAEPKLNRSMGEVYLTENEAAAMMKVSRRTLQRWRQDGIGPAFKRFGGAVRYAVQDIEAWAKRQTRLSTSDLGAS